jgi:hypothetical protein
MGCCVCVCVCVCVHANLSVSKPAVTLSFVHSGGKAAVT